MSLNAARRIDVHFHSVPPSYGAAISRLGGHIRVPEWSPRLAVDFLEDQGAAAGIMSLSVPGTHLGDNAEARDLARRCNEESAEYVQRDPRRLGAFAAAPLPDLDGACEAVVYALDKLKLDGVGLFGSYAGRYLGDPEWDPLLEILDERSAVCLVHPNIHPSVDIVREGGISPGIPNFMAEYPFDTSRAALNLVSNNVLDRFPNIRFILSHAGGTLPFLAWRAAAIVHRQTGVSPMRERFPSPFVDAHGENLTRETFLSRLRKFWYDTALSPGPQTFGSLLAVADKDKILFGSDWPYCPPVLCSDMVEQLHHNELLSEDDVCVIESDNAVALFPRFAS